MNPGRWGVAGVLVSALMWVLFVCVFFTLQGCATMASIDPVRRPPAEYRRPSTVVIEFVNPEMVAWRCLQRGAPVLANACATADLITMPNPCHFEGDAYARIQCHEVAHAQGMK